MTEADAGSGRGEDVTDSDIAAAREALAQHEKLLEMWRSEPDPFAYKGFKRSVFSGPAHLRSDLDSAMGHAPVSELDALMRLVGEGDLRAFDLRRASDRWRRIYFLLGLPAAILAAVSGAAGLATEQLRIPAALVALVSAGLSAAVTFLNSDDRAKVSHMLSAAWQEFADDARMAILRFKRAADSDQNAMETTLLELQRRKGRLLRGELPRPEPPRAIED
ncbi:hypothetical protein [Nocardia acidivorans]|uniref:hypothetical protein n=1 Tax=Nocardia acidivorans TaxID=404580 RepID=UPI000A8EB2D3|nr:hypothetical protein [Nocardia acidivorans]